MNMAVVYLATKTFYLLSTCFLNYFTKIGLGLRFPLFWHFQLFSLHTHKHLYAHTHVEPTNNITNSKPTRHERKISDKYLLCGFLLFYGSSDFSVAVCECVLVLVGNGKEGKFCFSDLFVLWGVSICGNFKCEIRQILRFFCVSFFCVCAGLCSWHSQELRCVAFGGGRECVCVCVRGTL